MAGLDPAIHVLFFAVQIHAAQKYATICTILTVQIHAARRCRHDLHY
jgi:hypothetical protein